MKFKKSFIALLLTLALGLAIDNDVLAISSQAGKGSHTCKWNKRTETCVTCAWQSECFLTVKTTYDEYWRVVKVVETRFPYSVPHKVTKFEYDRYGNVKKKETTKYHSHLGFPTKVESRETVYQKYGKLTKKIYLSYREDSTKIKKKVSFYNKKGIFNKREFYLYNKAGQLKSNDNGKAYKTIRYYKKNGKKYPVTKEIKYQYTKNGKLKRIK